MVKSPDLLRNTELIQQFLIWITVGMVKKDTFYEAVRGIECGYSNNDESLNEHAKNCRVG